MSEPRTVRLKEKSHPNRSADFDLACDKFAIDGNEVFRKLADAWMAYIKAHGRPPQFPVALHPVEGEEVPKRKPKQ